MMFLISNMSFFCFVYLFVFVFDRIMVIGKIYIDNFVWFSLSFYIWFRINCNRILCYDDHHHHHHQIKIHLFLSSFFRYFFFCLFSIKKNRFYVANQNACYWYWLQESANDLEEFLFCFVLFFFRGKTDNSIFFHF